MKTNDIVNAGEIQDVKVVVIGDAAAGKSAILKKFFKGTFDENDSATIGIDFYHITYQLQDGTKVRLQVWDTAGQERFRHLAPSYIRDAHVIIIVFDLTSTNIVEQIARWTLFAERERQEGAIVVIVGNKCDLRQRRLVKSTMDRIMAEYEASYIETSAKTGFNVEQLFSLVAHLPFPKHRKSQSAPIRLHSTSTQDTWLPTSCCS
ncbi:hypothetical protein Q1695_013839 [Nippostrongylus brasiliensis]|nr:hypothetical protein Q1695_013839 [Nippostrongylus brasiliensis]